MVAAFEILIANHPVRNIIREGKTHQLPNLITTNQAEGMCSLESSLADLVSAQIVDYEDALAISSHPKELSRLVGQRSPTVRDCVTHQHRRPARTRSPLLSSSRGSPRAARPGSSRRPSCRGRSSLPRSRSSSRPFSEVLDQRPSFAVIALNAPVGLPRPARPPAAGPATARRGHSSGPKRGSSIQSAPVRSSTNELEFLPDHLDAISMTLLPRYREVAAEMAPFRQRTVYEVHSDVCFFELNDGEPMQFTEAEREGHRGAPGAPRGEVSRRRPDPLGRAPRRAHCPTSSTSPPSSGRPGGSSHRAAVRIPEDPEWDEQGLRMEIVR